MLYSNLKKQQWQWISSDFLNFVQIQEEELFNYLLIIMNFHQVLATQSTININNFEFLQYGDHGVITIQKIFFRFSIFIHNLPHLYRNTFLNKRKNLWIDSLEMLISTLANLLVPKKLRRLPQSDIILIKGPLYKR